MYDLKAIVIGAGIGGLSSAIALRQAGYRVEVFERTRKLRPAGAGISLWSNGIKVLNRLGLGDKMAAIGGQMNRMEYRSPAGDSLSKIDLSPLFERVGQRPYPVARTDLQQMLLEAFGAENVNLGCKCVGVEEDADSVTAILEGGRRVTGDVLIAADGVRSTVREYIVGTAVEPRYAGYVNWNGLVPASDDLCEADNWVLYVGDGKRASMMPVGGDRFYYFFGCPRPLGTTMPPEKIRDELAETFSGWAAPVERLIERLDPEQTNRLEISDLDPLPRLVKGRVALLGDAGHATTPTLGQGGCQALEDSEVLCRYLISTTIGVADALKRYEGARKERTAELVLKARKRTDTIYGKDPAATQQWYEQLKQEDETDVVNALAKVILSGPLH